MGEVNTTFAIYYFFAIFAAYSYYKYSKGGVIGFWGNVIFFLSLVIGEFMINLGMSKDICGFSQPKSAAIATILPWVLVLGVLKSALILFPGWIIPFENTFGYIVVSAVTDIKTVFNDILTPQFDIKPLAHTSDNDNNQGGGGASGDNDDNNEMTKKREIGRALEQIYTDQSILLNELNSDNIQRFWDSFIASGLIKKEAKIENLEKIRGFLHMKTAIGEFIWLVLCGLLIVSISYNYMLNIGCTYTPEQQNIREKVLKDKQDAEEAENKEKKNKIVTITS
jgi:hypothetical protein